VQERIRTALDFMIAHATFQRDQMVLLLLRQTGARLSEIVEMTVGGYRKACHAGQALVRNKGSHGREEKTIYFTPVIEQQLQKYIQVERAAHDPQGRRRLAELDDSDALFLTERGTPYDRDAFYYHWNKLFEPAQKHFKKQDRVQFSPHDIRHLHVTTNMAKIKRSAQGDQGLEAELKDGFRLLMGWRSQETMDIYTHVLNKRKALLDIVMHEQAHEAVQRPVQMAPSPPSLTEPNSTSFERLERTKISPADDVSWYEEE
jgi:site-specific recombinase XerD